MNNGSVRLMPGRPSFAGNAILARALGASGGRAKIGLKKSQDTSLGRAMRAVRENELAAEA